MENSKATCSGQSDDPFFESDSSTDSESDFHGFDITDVRAIFTEAKKTTLFTSTPKKKPRKFTESESSDEPAESLHQLVDEDTDSDISGEIIESIFVSRKRAKITEDSSTIPSDKSDSDIEGEFNDRPITEQSQGDGSDSDTHEVDKSYAKKPKGKHRSTVLSTSDLEHMKCCSNQCVEKLSREQLQKARDKFCKEYPTYEQQRKMILNWFDNNQPESGKFAFTISGLPVCWSAWTQTLGITARRFYNLKSDYLKGRRNEKHGSFGNIPYSEQTDKVIRFLEKYFKEHCDYLPNTPIWHLSSNTRKSDVYEDMRRDMVLQGMSVCSNATFRSVWKTQFSHVKIPKENRFGKCDTCSNIRDMLRKEGTNNVGLCKRKTDHRHFVRNERATYLDRCAAGHQNPNMFFSIAIDGMDQNKTELPFTVWRHGFLEKAWRLKVHVVGALIHGRHPITFLDYQQHPHDSNMTSNLLMQALWIHRDCLPSTLYLQLDNTCKENKNQYVFAFLAYLVETKVFDKIETCFLPVGHTHIDVDQMFSRLSVGIARRGAKTFQDLLKLIHSCYTQNQGEVNQEGARPQYARINHMYAIREWLKPCAQDMHRLRHHHHFKFIRNGEGKCIVDHKPWCSSTPRWDRTKWPPFGPVFESGLPDGIPCLVKPSFEAVNFGRLESMASKCLEKGILTEPEKKLWDEFLAEEISYAEGYEEAKEIEECDKNFKDELTYIQCEDDHWPIDDLIGRPRPSEEEHPSLDEVLMASEAYEQGDGFLPVYTGRYRPPNQQSHTQVMHERDLKELEVGMLAALEMEKYSERPLIAGIKEILPDNKIKVVWYCGSWTTKWTPAKRKEGRQWEEWTEEVESECVVLFDFTLTNSGKLRSHSLRHLKECYGME